MSRLARWGLGVAAVLLVACGVAYAAREQIVLALLSFASDRRFQVGPHAGGDMVEWAGPAGARPR